MAPRWSALRNAVGKNVGSPTTVRRFQNLSRALHGLLLHPTSSPSSRLLTDEHDDDHDRSEPQPSISGRHPAGLHSMGVSEMSNLSDGFQGTQQSSLPSQRSVILDSEAKLVSLALRGGAPGVPTMRHIEGKSVHWWQKRSISSTSCHFFPRRVGRRLPRFAYKQTTSNENFERRPVAKRLPESEYRQAIVVNSTKNLGLVPKKWTRALPSREVVDAVSYLRRAKRNPDAVKQVIRKRVARLLKLELMLVLAELQRLDEWVLARQVFNAVRKESWYRPNVYLYQTMVQLFGRNKQIKEAQNMFEELEAEGLQPDDSIRRELLRAYVGCGMNPTAVELYKEIQKAGLDRAARSILFHGLNDVEKQDLAAYEKEKGYDWS